MKKVLLFLVSLVCFSLFNSALADETWQPAYVGADPKVLYLPDTKAVYWRYGWAREAGDQKGLVIKGKMPSVRYFSYNVYNENTKNTVGSLTDFELVPDDSGPNPFKVGKAPAAQNYTIYVVPEGSKVDAKNVLYFPDSLTKVSTFLRHYVSAGDQKGNVPTPVIQTYDAKTGAVTAAPVSNDIPKLSKTEFKKYVLPMLKKLAVAFKEDPEKTLEQVHIKRSSKTLDIKQLVATQVVSNTFNYYQPGKRLASYNFVASGTYPNNDNHYLTMPVVRQMDDEVLLYKFKAPKRVQSASDYPSAPVRYFSLSQGDAATYTHGTTIDREMLINEDGMVYFLIGNDSAALRAKAKALKANFMAWESGHKMLLVYRHMLPKESFKGATDKVAVFDKTKPAPPQEGQLYIGAYSPTGKMVKLADILAADAIPAF